MRRKSNVSALLGYTKGFRPALFLSFALMAVGLIISFVSPLILSVTIDSVLEDKPLNSVWYIAWFVRSVGGVDVIRNNLWIMAVAILALQILSGAVNLGRAYLNAYAGEGAIKKLRDRLYSHIQRLPFSWHASQQTGDIIQRSTSDVDTVRSFISNTLLEFVRTIIMLVVGISVMFSLNKLLTYVTMGMIIPVAATSVFFFSRIRKLGIIQEDAEGRLFTDIQENLTGVRVVRAFGREKFEMEKFIKCNEENRYQLYELDKQFANLWTSLDLLCGIEMALVSILGVYSVVNGSLTIGNFTAFTSYIFLFFWPLRGFGRVLNHFSRSIVATGRLEEIFDAEEEEGLYEGLTPPVNGDVVFKNVNFSYDKYSILKNLNMTIPGGKTVAILGGTGSGKSTLAMLLQRLYDIDSGSITIGGIDIKKIKKTYLRQRVSIVLQEPFLYSKTILQNIGIKREQPDKDEVTTAAKDASIHDDILSFEDGYQTVVGERGVTLSGGQKQRIAIARALIGDSDMLIFDDSLSAVDTRTDTAIRNALAKRRSNITTMIISHRITTLMDADMIYVLKDGAVVEEGTHDELMALGGIYRRTYDIQNSSIEEGGRD